MIYRAFVRCVAGLLGAAILTGCASAPPKVWSRPSSTQQDFAQDRYACAQEAKISYSRTYVNAYGGGSRSDVRIDSTLFNACMEARGWRLVERTP
jgi:hypothetical protein